MITASVLLLAFAASTTDRPLVAFDEPGFPTWNPNRLAVIPERSRVAASGSELATLLHTIPDAILVWRHDSVFPADAWSAIVEFLEGGGDLVSLVGEPFTIPVTGTPGARTKQRRSVSPLRDLGLLHPRLEFAGLLTMEYRAAAGFEPFSIEPGAEGQRVCVLEPRFTNDSTFPDEEGAPGRRDAALRPIAQLWYRSHVAPPYPHHCGAYAIDRLRGRFAGGRWVFRLLTTAPSEQEIERLLAEAARDPIELSATPVFACVSPDEAPALRLRVTAPESGVDATWNVRIALFAASVRSGEDPTTRLTATLTGGDAESIVPLPRCEVPGAWRVRVECDGIETLDSGFEVLDASGEPALPAPPPLTFRGDTLFSGDRPHPLFGTTLMSPDVHRAFLFEPNPAVWDAAFLEIRRAGMNCVRTGLWYGWKQAMPTPGAVDESFLRALEAYAIAARRHGVTLIFTFFAFLPETWGGEHAYLDPKAIAAQRTFVSAIASRLARYPEVIYDLINEPSFSPPSLTWRSRPSGTESEAQAFRAWLASEYPATNGDIDEATIRARWNLAPNESIGPPPLSDFDDPQVFAHRRPERARDWLRFANAAFANWTKTMRDAIRMSAKTALVTVGQDEGGLLERPHPLLHAREVDFTSLHTWWWNDALYFDAFCAKALGKPMLVSETGIQPRELHDGSSERDGHESALLLSRKIATAYAARAFGVIQWCWHTNPYLNSDAESLIGLVRVDGSETWELRAMREFATFVERHRDRLVLAAKPDVAFVLPQTDLTGPRAMTKDGIARALERLAGRLGRTVQVIPEWEPGDLSRFDTIVVPAARSYRPPLMAQLDAAFDRGALVAMSGSPFADAHLRDHPNTLGVVERLSRFESVVIGRETFDLEFPLAAYESGFRSGIQDVAALDRGLGKRIACGVPIEWSGNGRAIEAFYANSVGARSHPYVPAAPEGVFVTAVALEDGTLVAMINETRIGVELPVGRRESDDDAVFLDAGKGKLVLLDRDGRYLDETRF